MVVGCDTIQNAGVQTGGEAQLSFPVALCVVKTACDG